MVFCAQCTSAMEVPITLVVCVSHVSFFHHFWNITIAQCMCQWPLAYRLTNGQTELQHISRIQSYLTANNNHMATVSVQNHTYAALSTDANVPKNITETFTLTANEFIIISAKAHALIEKLCKLFGLSCWKRLQASQVHLLKGRRQVTVAQMCQQFFAVINFAYIELKE